MSPMAVTLTLPPLPARRAPLRVLLGVLALHTVLLGLATQLGVWPDRGPAPVAPAPLMLRLLDSAPPNRARKPTPQALPPRRVLRPPDAPPAAPVRSEPQAITLPAPATAAPEVAQRPTGTANPPAALNLILPRAASAPWRQRSPALDDARANTRVPVNLATLIDQALGGDPYGSISEEHLADGSVRFRRGRQCVIARPNQAQALDPYNSSFSPKPRLLDTC